SADDAGCAGEGCVALGLGAPAGCDGSGCLDAGLGQAGACDPAETDACVGYDTNGVTTRGLVAHAQGSVSCPDAGCVAATGTGDATGGALAASATGGATCQDAGCVAVAPLGQASGGVTVSGD